MSMYFEGKIPNDLALPGPICVGDEVIVARGDKTRKYTHCIGKVTKIIGKKALVDFGFDAGKYSLYMLRRVADAKGNVAHKYEQYIQPKTC